jgi:small nuclear ribonucleoprotein (snRNP)-like protein
MVDSTSKTMQKMVVHKADGTVIKGISYNFSPFLNIVFHLEIVDPVVTDAKSAEIRISTLKAIFIVKSFPGNPDYKDKKCFQDPGIQLQPGRKAEVEFVDGEKIYGMIFTFDPKKIGFWLFPIDPNDNNEKVFVVSNMVKEVKFV